MLKYSTGCWKLTPETKMKSQIRAKYVTSAQIQVTAHIVFLASYRVFELLYSPDKAKLSVVLTLKCNFNK